MIRIRQKATSTTTITVMIVIAIVILNAALIGLLFLVADSFSSPLPYAFAQQLPNAAKGQQQVLLQNIHTLPANIHVGDNFIIGATVINNSPHAITFICGPCSSPLSAHFDRNVKVENGVSCYAAAILVTLQPGQSADVTGPTSGVLYKAISSGRTNAVVTFNYDIKIGGSSTAASVSNFFSFTILS